MTTATATATAMAAPELLLLLPDTLAERLRAQDTRAAALQALDKLPPPCPPELALAAAPALVDVAAATEEREVLDRCGLLLARLLAEALPDPSAVYGAALGGERGAGSDAPFSTGRAAGAPPPAAARGFLILRQAVSRVARCVNLHRGGGAERPRPR